MLQHFQLELFVLYSFCYYNIAIQITFYIKIILASNNDLIIEFVICGTCHIYHNWIEYQYQTM